VPPKTITRKEFPLYVGPAGRAPSAGRGHFVTYAELRVVLPMVAS